MKRFAEGEDRTRVTLLPECLNDYIADDHPAGVIDVFIDDLDLRRPTPDADFFSFELHPVLLGNCV